MDRCTYTLKMQGKEVGSSTSKTLHKKGIPLVMLGKTLHALRTQGLHGKVDLYINIPHGCFCAEENYVRSVLL